MNAIVCTLSIFILMKFATLILFEPIFNSVTQFMKFGNIFIELIYVLLIELLSQFADRLGSYNVITNICIDYFLFNMKGYAYEEIKNEFCSRILY